MDLIDRQAAISAVTTELAFHSYAGNIAANAIKSVPSAEKVLKPVFGDWIWDDEGYHCPECWYHAYDNSLEVETHWKFCPVCGARLKCKESEE